MATKLNDMLNKFDDFMETLLKKRTLVAGCALGISGIFIFYNMIEYRAEYPTEQSVFFGVLGNLFLAGTVIFLIRYFLRERLKYQEWEAEGFYEKWQESFGKVEKRMKRVGILALIAAVCYYWYLVSGGAWLGAGNGWYSNLASGYILVVTVLIQFILCRELFLRYKNKSLDLMMEKIEEVSRKRLDEALEIERASREKVSRSDQLRVDLITNVSHDLKTPLTSMVGYIELIKKEELSDVVRDYIDVISARAEKLKEMINSLFSLAKASSGNVELHKEKIELNRLVEQTLADMDDQIRGSGLQFVKQFTEENTELISDNAYFYRICQNLVENALKYSAKGTRVFVKTSVRCGGAENMGSAGTGKNGGAADGENENAGAEADRRHLCLEITNTAGYYMDFTKEDIVERFARGDKARSSEGNGLGLAIVSTYAKALGGEFDIRIDCDQFKACVEMPVGEM